MVLNSYSQHFPEDHAIWTKYHQDFYGMKRRIQYIQFGDTSINGTQYSKLFRSYEQYSFDSLVYSYYNVFIGSLKPDFDYNKVYFIPKDSTNEVLLYDFNLQVNDTLPVWHNEFSKVITVESIDTVVVEGKSLKLFEMNYGNLKDPVYGDLIVEGIGSIKELIKIEDRLEGIHGFNCFTDFQTGFKYPADCNTFVLSTAENRIDQIKNISVSPNPCSDFFTVTFEGVETKKTWIKLTDLNGNLVYSTQILNGNQIINTVELNNGIYIVLVYNDNGLQGTGKVLINK